MKYIALELRSRFFRNQDERPKAIPIREYVEKWQQLQRFCGLFILRFREEFTCGDAAKSSKVRPEIR
jgi:hypothetical protein